MITIPVRAIIFLGALLALLITGGEQLYHTAQSLLAIDALRHMAYGATGGFLAGYLCGPGIVASRRYRRGIRKLRDERRDDAAW